MAMQSKYSFLSWKKPVHIFLDMDGVVTDFCSCAQRIYPRFNEIKGLYQDGCNTKLLKDLRKEFIDTLKDEDLFWYNLKPLHNTKRLISFLYDNFYGNISIITAPIDEDYERCYTQKFSWSNKHLSQLNINYDRFHVEHNKYRLIDSVKAKAQILIDDRPLNVDEWNRYGGIGILHDENNVQNTIDQLIEYI